MNSKKFFSTLAIIATMSMPILFASQAQASDRSYQNHERQDRHAYRDGYRAARHDDRDEHRSYRYQRRHGYGHGYRGYRARHNYNYRPYIRHSGIELVFHF